MSHNIELFNYWRSSCSWRVRWALHHKKIPFTSTPINLLKNEQQSNSFLQRNTTGQVPVLLVNGTHISESMAILEWLEENYPNNKLLPTSTRDKAKARELCYTISAGIQPLQNLKVLKFAEAHGIPRNTWASHWIDSGLASIEEKIQTTAGTFAFGGTLSLVDLCLIPQIYSAKRFGINIGAFPTIERIYKYCLTLPACHKAAPEQQSDAVP